MINFDNIKAVFIDFDDSLCIHLKHDNKPDSIWFKAQVENDKTYYLNKEQYKPLPGMKCFLDRLESLAIPTYGLTWAFYSTIEPLKLEFVKHYYGENKILKMICTAGKEDKITFIKRYCDLYNLNLEQILFVDDHPETINMAINAGINIRTPQEICVYFAEEEMLSKFSTKKQRNNLYEYN